MFNKASRPTVTESVVEAADSAVESADSTADSAADPVKISLWVWAFSPKQGLSGPFLVFLDQYLAMYTFPYKHIINNDLLFYIIELNTK